MKDEDVQVKFDNTGNEPLKVPGFRGISLAARAWQNKEFASIEPWSWYPAPFSARELAMLRLMNSVTERANWDKLVFDESTLQTWRKEAMEEFSLISPKAWDWCVAELRDKAHMYQETGLMLVLNAGTGVCKSDTIIPSALGTETQDFVTSILEERAGQKDWEWEWELKSIAKQSQQVWTLIDPSLYPLVCERTRVLLGGDGIPIEQTLDAYGQGEVVPLFHDHRTQNIKDRDPYSQRYQWLPCEVEFCGPAGSTDMQITSYVNNLHPRKQRSFYKTLEAVISRTIEPWNETLVRYMRQSPRRYHHTVGREPLRMRTYGVEWENRYPQWAEELPATLDVDKSSEDYQRLLVRVKEYLALPEYGVNAQWEFCTTRDIPEDWETTLSLREAVNIKYSRMFRFKHSEPGTTYSYDDWKAGRTARAIVSREKYDDRDSESELWQNRFEIMDPMIQAKMISAKEDFDHQFQTVKLQDEFRERGLQIIVKLGGD